MAHNLNYNPDTKKHSFFSVQQKPWHSLGTLIEEYPTSAEALKFADLDFQVAKAPNLHTLPSGLSITSEQSFFTYRTDNEAILGDKLGKDYQIVQNIDAFSFFDSIVGNNQDIRYETAGALGKGERIFITAKLPDYIRVGKDDLIEQYVFLTTSHDGYGSITAAFTPVRVVCQNTLNAAMKNHSNCIKIRHTASAMENLRQAHRLMGITNQLATEMEGLYNHWAKIRINDQQVKKLIAMAMAPSKDVLNSLMEEKFHYLSTHYLNIVENVFEYALSAPFQQQPTTMGTLFGAYNAVTGYFQNVRKFPDEEHKLKSIMYGTALLRAQTTFNLCNDFANNKIQLLT